MRQTQLSVYTVQSCGESQSANGLSVKVHAVNGHTLHALVLCQKKRTLSVNSAMSRLNVVGLRLQAEALWTLRCNLQVKLAH